MTADSPGLRSLGQVGVIGLRHLARREPPVASRLVRTAAATEGGLTPCAASRAMLAGDPRASARRREQSGACATRWYIAGPTTTAI